jgi:hypothetical protein
MHLTPEQLIDIVEGTRSENAEPHLRSCEICRHQIGALRAAMSSAAQVDVSEPSPLFWDHFSQRVRAAVDAEGAPARGGIWGMRGLLRWSWSTVAIGGVVAALALAVYLTAPRSPTRPPSTDDTAAAVTEGALLPLGSIDDPSLALVADLTGQLDADAVNETTWTNHAGAVDEVVSTLTIEERVELQRLLQEVLAKRGA